VREVEIVPLEVVVRNVAAGSLSQRLGIEEGTQLPRSIIGFYYKNDQLNDPWCPKNTSRSAGRHRRKSATSWRSPRQRFWVVSGYRHPSGRFQDGMQAAVRKRNDADHRRRRDLAHSCRLWDIKSNELDKDRFRRDLGRLEAIPRSPAAWHSDGE
jgi:phosphoribosylaminoimidazole-succinocarboxamide synthase